MMNEPPPFYIQPGLHVETYDALLGGGPGATHEDVAFYLARARETGGPVLDLCCGTGRVTWPLAEAGLEVVGVDLSEAMLHLARAKGAAHSEAVRARVTLLQGDMRGFDAGRPFALAIIPFRSFQALLTPEDQRRCLGCIRTHLAPGGRLVLHLFDPRLDWCHPGASPPPYRGEAPHPETGRRVRAHVLTRTPDPLHQVLDEVWRFTETDADGRIVREEDERLRMRWTYRHEARYLFEAAGFEVEAEYSDFSGTPPAYGREMVWDLRRP